MKLTAEEFEDIVRAGGFASAGPSAHEALEHLIQQWVEMLLGNLSQVAADPATKISRRHFASLERRMGPLAGALHKSAVQTGGDYYLPSEYFGADSGRYHSSPGADQTTSSATALLARQGMTQRGGGGGRGAAGACVSLQATERFLKGTGREFTESAVTVVQNMLTIMLRETFRNLRRRFPGQQRLTVLMLSLADRGTA